MNRTIEQFRNGDLVINCRTAKDANTLMLLFDKYLIKWDRNTPASSNSNWSKHAEKTGYHCGPQELLYVDSIDCQSEKNRRIIEFNDFIKNRESEQPTPTPNIETAIKDVISNSLDSGLIEKLVKENLEIGVNKALENLFSTYGEATKVIEKEIKSVMLSQLDAFNYSKHIVKLDQVLVEILQNTTLDNRKILGNFKELMSEEKPPKNITSVELFNAYKKHVAENVDTSDLEIDYENYDEPRYKDINATLETVFQDSPSWSNFEYCSLLLCCEEDESLNIEIKLSKYNDKPWTIDRAIETTVRSLRYLSDFDLYLLKLSQITAEIEIDKMDLDDYVAVEEEPDIG